MQAQSGRVMVGRRPEVKRLQELAAKKSQTKTSAEINEEILLRLQRIEEALGIVGGAS